VTIAPPGTAPSSIGFLHPLEAARPRERTPWLLGFFCVLIPILPSYSVPAGPLKSNGSPARIISVLLFLLVVLGFFLVRRSVAERAIRPGVVITVIYFSLLLVVYGVGVSHARDPIIDANMTRALINLLANAGVVIYILTRIRTARERNILLGCLAVGLAFTCAVGLLQSLSDIDLRFLFQPPGFVVNTEHLEIDERFGAKRVVGTTSHPIEFSVLSAITIPLTLHFARFAKRRDVRLLAALGCGLALAAMPAAVSRTGVVALVAVLLVYMWSFKVRSLLIGAAVAGLAFGAYVMTFPDIINALWNTITNSEDDPSVHSRVADYAQVSDTFRDHPWFGLGLGGSPPTEYGFLDNEWLQQIVQGGVIGIAAMLLFTGAGFVGISASLRGATNRRERDQAYMLGSMFAGIMSSSVAFDLFSFQQATKILFIVFALLWCTYSVPWTEASQSSKELTRAAN
jgi:polysaccharide biosynthesis protein PslJ